ncbi:hypothetical protein [Pseudactinotalea sp. Z1748]|uniref:hypothetical protein n=1 Tax=Pseudactinotalea sp. Z1748 TaxID=3413027 RepID=UPI003C7C89C2
MYAPVQSWDGDKNTWEQPSNALAVPDHYTRARRPITVIATIIWPRSGTGQVPGIAEAWTPRAVLVYIDDRRLRIRGVWLPAHNVRRA